MPSGKFLSAEHPHDGGQTTWPRTPASRGRALHVRVPWPVSRQQWLYIPFLRPSIQINITNLTSIWPPLHKLTNETFQKVS